MISKVKESIEAVTAQGDPFAESNKYIMGPRPPPSRCHTEAFLFMRSSALQRRRFVIEQEEEISDDRVSLLRKEEEGQVAPEWTSRVERLNYQMTVAETRVQELDTMHRALLSRPGIEDGDAEERNIQRLTQETTALFSAAQRQLVEMQRYSQRLRGREKLVVGNIVAATEEGVLRIYGRSAHLLYLYLHLYLYLYLYFILFEILMWETLWRRRVYCGYIEGPPICFICICICICICILYYLKY